MAVVEKAKGTQGVLVAGYCQAQLQSQRIATRANRPLANKETVTQGMMRGFLNGEFTVCNTKEDAYEKIAIIVRWHE